MSERLTLPRGESDLDEQRAKVIMAEVRWVAKTYGMALATYWREGVDEPVGHVRLSPEWAHLVVRLAGPSQTHVTIDAPEGSGVDLNWYATGGRCPDCGAPKRYREWWDNSPPTQDAWRRMQYDCAREMCDWRESR